MEDIGEVMTATIITPIQQTAEVTGETLGSVVEPIVESAHNASFAEIPIEGLQEGGDDFFGFDEALSEECDSAEVSEEEQIEDAREELKEITEVEEPEPEKDDGYDEQLATLNETIRLLEIQRDAIKEQLGGGLITFLARLADYFFAETLMEKPSLVENSPIDQPTEAWKEDARFQLRTLETKIAELKQLRGRLVANN